MNKEFCKSTSVVLAEVCKALKTNPMSILVGKTLTNTQGKLICYILGNIINNDT